MSQRAAEKLRRELDGVKGRRGPCFTRDLKERAGAGLAERQAAYTIANWDRLTRFGICQRA